VNPLASLAASPLWSQPPLAIAANIIVSVAFVLVAGAIILDFAAYHRRDAAVVSSDRSLVETGSMTAFFVVYYLVIRFHLLEPDVPAAARGSMVVAGLLLIVAGVAVNIWGRLLLKSRWANQIKIYADHTLVTAGPYAVVRHPLYASLIWIFIGGALVYANPLSLALTLGVFVPMMYVRAKQEDAVLLQNFTDEYPPYRARTGMFFPRLWG
jgi:protein-S-isoprenylcysteine O-methyltransferase Ste14